MAKADLTAARLRELLHYDPQTGVFTWLMRRGAAAKDSVAGCINPNGNIVIYVDGSPYQAHHLAWLYVNGAFAGGNVGHRNKDRGDNRIDNLRDWSIPEKRTRTKAPLTADRLRELIDYNPDTGVFTRKIKVGKRGAAGDLIGCINPTGRIEISVEGRICLAHRLAWLYMTGAWPVNVIDHRDGNPANNVFGNLRDVTSAGNAQNQRRPGSANTSGYLGVRRKRQKWAAAIQTSGVVKHIGTFDTPEDAYAAYIEAKRALHSTCTI